MSERVMIPFLFYVKQHFSLAQGFLHCLMHCTDRQSRIPMVKYFGLEAIEVQCFLQTINFIQVVPTTEELIKSTLST